MSISLQYWRWSHAIDTLFALLARCYEEFTGYWWVPLAQDFLNREVIRPGCAQIKLKDPKCSPYTLCDPAVEFISSLLEFRTVIFRPGDLTGRWRRMPLNIAIETASEISVIINLGKLLTVLSLLLFISFQDGIARCSNPSDERVDCGWRRITESQCTSRGCCYNSTVRYANWCFYKQGNHFVVLHEIVASQYSDITYLMCHQKLPEVQLFL